MATKSEPLPATASELLLSGKKSPVPRVLLWAPVSLSLIIAFYHLYTGWFGLLHPFAQRHISLSLLLILAFLLYPTGRRSWRDRINSWIAVDILAILLTVIDTVYIIVNFDQLTFSRVAMSTPLDTVIGSIYLVIVIEATRRTVGWPMVAITVFFVLQNLTAERLFGWLYGASVPWKVVVEVLWMGDNGIFSLPMMVVASYMLLFFIFVGLMLRCGAGDQFVNLAIAVAGRYAGGPAKVAVIGSSLMGMVQGASSTNAAAVGSVTIPMMKRTGYQPHFAAAVEAVASTGGQIMPPIMGTAAFLIAEYLNIPYWKVCLMAVIPSVAYYASAFMTVHWEAKKTGLAGLPREQVPSFGSALSNSWPVLIPVVVLIGGIAAGQGLAACAIYATLAMFVIAMFRKDMRWTPVRLLAAIEDGARLGVTIAPACASAGIIIGSFYVSGLSGRLSQAIISTSQGELWIALVITAIVGLILGMAVTVTAVYITLLLVAIPALVQMGCPVPVAHFFAFYYGCLSAITPPVAIAAFVTAGIAGANAMQVGLTASRIAVPIYIIPFFFAANPGSLWMGSPLEILIAFITIVVGSIAIAAGFEGWFLHRTNILERIFLWIGGLGLIVPDNIATIIGLCLLIAVVVSQIVSERAKKRAAPGTG